MTPMKHDAPQAAVESPLLAWLADSRFNVWLTRMFWLLLILETILWTSTGQLFVRGDVIAPVLFVASKALVMLGASAVLARFVLRLRQNRKAESTQQLTTATASAIFLLWFGATIAHLASVLLLRLVELAGSTYGGKGSDANFDLIDALLKEAGFESFSSVGSSYLAVSSALYGLAALGLFRLLAKRWPARPSSSAAALPAWPWLLAAYVAAATLHGLLMRL